MSVAEEAFRASKAMWEVALRGARDNLSDVRMSGNQTAIKRAEDAELDNAELQREPSKQPELRGTR